jgi:hypothetical protein
MARICADTAFLIGVVNRAMNHIHITGCGRSGTTLLMEMMRSCFRCDGPSHHETSILEVPPRGFSVYITKHPGEVSFLGPLLGADPDLHGIHIYRDPRSVICSVHAKAKDCYAVNFSSWKKQQKLAEHPSRHPRFLTVCYEKLVTNPDIVQGDIRQAFPFLEPKGSFSTFHERARPSFGAIQALNGLRVLDEARLEPWRYHLPRVKEQLIRHPEMADMLIELGYETDRSWTGLLSDVEARSHKVWEERGLHPLKKLDQWHRRRRRLCKRLSLLQRDAQSANFG